MTQTNITIGCPKCGSTQLSANKKGFSGKNAVAGAVLTGGIGLLAGTIGSNKIKITCLSCGNQFRPGEGRNIIIKENQSIERKAPVNPTSTSEFNRILCSNCKTENFTSHNFCKKCGKELDERDERIQSNQKVGLFSCTSCKKLAPRDGKFCPHCKALITPPKEGCFIATACFGDYNAPEVFILRKYRDEVLNQSRFGKIFIQIYYAISPPFAKVISHCDLFKNSIRMILLKPMIFMMGNKNTKR